MSAQQPRDYWDHVGLAKLVGGFLLAPFELRRNRADGVAECLTNALGAS